MMMKLHKVCLVLLCLFIATSFGAIAPAAPVAAAGELKPFPQQVSYPGVIKPSHVTQAAMNQAVAAYYDYWKATYLRNNLTSLPGGYYVKGNITGDPDGFTALGSSEGQGYGMIITVLMAGYDPNAKTIYDGLFKTARAYKSSGNPNLMGWVVADSKAAQGHFGSATDGDLDIAYSLILAHNQWGSGGEINYLQEAKKMITDGIKASYVTTGYRLNLGDWDGKDALNTRPSDWMLSHLRAFCEVTGDETWIHVIDNLYDVYQQFTTMYSPNTGLISDFVVGNPPRPAPEWYLEEFKETNQYYYNASRVPLRIVMDYALYGDTRAKALADQMVNWMKNKTGGSPANIKNGYKLDGTAIGNYATAVFVAPFISAGTANSSNQAWVNAGWDWMKNKKEDYFSDSYNLLNLLFLSGNWWKPGGATVPEAPNLALNKTAVSSTIEGVGFEPDKAVDGNQMTRWASREGTDPEWIYVDLGSVHQITGVKLRWEAAYAKRYKIEISTDNGSPEHWQEVYSNSSGDGGLDEIPLSPQPARYVRMYGIERGTPYGYSLYEFEVTGQ
ncbi:F5/8 type C domain protein [Paenibacillus sp. oral taxon 786 str. D14]|nr:F5/8 type C domain protein [Paenibacillus sp. oral taxon 786 str. D14]